MPLIARLTESVSTDVANVCPVILAPIVHIPFSTIVRTNAPAGAPIALPPKEHSRVFAKKAFQAINANILTVARF